MAWAGEVLGSVPGRVGNREACPQLSFSGVSEEHGRQECGSYLFELVHNYMTLGRPGSVGMVLVSKVLGELTILCQCSVCGT